MEKPPMFGQHPRKMCSLYFIYWRNVSKARTARKTPVLETNLITFSALHLHAKLSVKYFKFKCLNWLAHQQNGQLPWRHQKDEWLLRSAGSCITAVHWEEKSSGHFSSPLYTPSKNQACGQMATGKEQRLHVVFRPKIARSQKYLITKSGLTWFILVKLRETPETGLAKCGKEWLDLCQVVCSLMTNRYLKFELFNVI